MQLLILAGIACIVTAVVAVLRRRRRYGSLKHIRGPASPSWLLGHDFMITRQQEVGDYDFEWLRDYGATWRIGGHLGTDVLMTADPKAMQHIFHKSGYNYRKRRDMTESTRMFTGPGIIAAHGEEHQRHRKIMNPAFSAHQLRSFLPLFQDIALKMCEKWKMEEQEPIASCKTLFVNKWLARTTLDIVGEAAFNYDYGALDSTDNRLAKEYNDIFIDSSLHPSRWSIFYRTMWNYLPDTLLQFVQYAPTRENRRIRRAFRVFEEVAGQLLREKTVDDADNARQKDVMSILVKANISENPKTQLSDKEMMAQMSSLTIAGHETTSSTLSWMLWELARYPDYQVKMREEIRATRAAVIARGDSRFNVDDLDSMTMVMNAIKETLRFHPIVFALHRVALKDDVIPLSEPITSATGEVLHEIPIRAGQWITTSLCGYNRLPQVWGEHADIWDPERFLRIDPTKQVHVGVLANLMTFSAGVRGCIGWRFSVLEMQALAAELLEKFEYALPQEQYDIMRVPAGLMIPLVRGRIELGSVMPLRVSPVV